MNKEQNLNETQNQQLNIAGVIPRFIVGTTVKTIVSKNKDKNYRQERKGIKGIIDNIGISLNRICYWVNFGDHYSWIDESDLNVV